MENQGPLLGRRARRHRNTFERLGIRRPKESLGVGAQYESEVVYHPRRREGGVVFMDMDSGLREHEDRARALGTIIPADDNKFSALNSAVWSGGFATCVRRVST